MPFYIKVPGIFKPGSLCETPVSGIDFLPTLMQLAGIDAKPVQTVDGVSLKPLQAGGTIAPRPLFWHYPHYGNQGGEPSSIVRDGDWKLIHYWEDDHNELYQLSKDIGERHDLAATEPERADRLWNKLQAWLNETDAKFSRQNPGYQSEWTAQKHQSWRAMKIGLEKEHAGYLKPDWQPNPTWWDSLITKD